MKNTNLLDYEVNPKIILAGLWTSVMFCYVYGDYFEFYTPNKLRSLLDNTSTLNTPTYLLLASILMVIPSLMISFSLILKPKINQILNITFGVIYTIIMVLIAISSFATAWQEFYFLYAIIESVITSIIVWRAFNWTRN